LSLSLASVATGLAAAPYPPPGAPEPDAPCARSHPAAGLDFFCRFLTLERWLEAGQPEYVEAGGKRWQAWFYGKDGLTNQLLVEGKDYVPEREGWFEALFDVGDFEAQTYSYFWDLFRYAPWSVQFLYAGECHGGQALAPAALASARFRRMHVFGLGWPGLAADPADPGRTFGPAAFPLLLAFTDLPRTLEPALLASMTDAGAVRAEVNALATGRGRLWPDYTRAGGVWLIDGDGAVTAMDDLDAAARRLAAAGVLVTNDAMRSWESGRRVAADIARRQGPVLYLYFAQDPFSPIDPAGAYGRRLDYLLDRAAADGGKSMRVVSYGRSAGIVAHALAGRPAIAHQSYMPAVSPLDAGEYAKALRRAVAGRRIDIVAPALSMEKDAPADCLDPLS
jgi:pimeloyl-ACP methyl ester carboxylesterase